MVLRMSRVQHVRWRARREVEQRLAHGRQDGSTAIISDNEIEALRQELAPRHVRVGLVEPGDVISIDVPARTIE